MRVITRTQIDAMIDEAVRDALSKQQQQMDGQQREQMLEATRDHLKALEMERDEERRRRRDAEASEDALRTKVRDLENAAKLRGELLKREVDAAVERGRAEAHERIRELEAQLEGAGAQSPPAGVNVEELMEQMRTSLAEEIALKLEAARRQTAVSEVKETEIILDTLFKDRLETNQAPMKVRTSTGRSVSQSLNKLKAFHNGRETLEIQPETD